MLDFATNNKKSLCCGCEACAQCCPKQCITMFEDSEGFLYPQVDKSSCIDCGLCEKVCPVIHQDEPTEPLSSYIAINPNEEIRLKSSSGGIFTLLAEKIIAEGGVVFGARFDKNWDVVHAWTDTMEGFAPFRGSKYVQSRIGNTYNETKEFLQQGRKVLFSGTPCQIAGLKKYLRKEYENLLTVDFICHGVPSPGVWSRYLSEFRDSLRAERGDGKNTVSSSIDELPVITGISFRDKSKGWKKYGFHLRYAASKAAQNSVSTSVIKDEEFLQPYTENSFMQGFLADIYLRPSCYDCPAKSGKSGSDISIADAWGMEHFAGQYDDDKGACYVLINTERGRCAMSSLEFKQIDVDFELIKKHNPAWMNSALPHRKRKLFYRLFSPSEMNFNEIIKKVLPPSNFFDRLMWSINKRIENMRKPLKILLIGTGSLRNYGCEAIVQGTYQIIREALGGCDITVASDDIAYDSTILPSDIKLVSYKRRFSLYRIYKGILRRCFHIGNGSPVRMNTKIAKKYDVVLSCGGDNYCEAPDGTIYTLLEDLMEIGRVAKNNKKKYVLWGASVGPFKTSDNHNRVMANLELADLITVREKLSYQYLSTNKNVKLVADPAFRMTPDPNVQLNREKDKRYIGINISLLSISHAFQESEDDVVVKIFEKLDNLLMTHPDWHFVCIPHVMSSPNGAQNDYVFMSRYLGYTAHKDRVSILPENLGARKTKGYIAQLDLLIAARMHCCVAGISVGTPTLFITYSNKGKGMSEYAYGHHDFELEVPQLLTVDFGQKIEEMLLHAEEINQYLLSQQVRFVKDSTHGGYLLDNCIHLGNK